MFYQKKKDSKSQRIYYYECENNWDKEAKKYVCKRKLIGRWDPESNTVIPTRPRARQGKGEAPEQDEPAPAKRGRKKKPEDYQELYEKERLKVQELEALLEEKDRIIQNQASVIESYSARKG